MTMLRRLFWLGVLAGAGIAARTVWQRRQAPAAGSPSWPPFDGAAAPGATVTFASMPTDDPVPHTEAEPAAPEADTDDMDDTEPTAAPPPTDASATWVAPDGGACPTGFPIKANDNSGIFHVPGGRFYDRTVPERCYADPADAEADGYRRAKA